MFIVHPALKGHLTLHISLTYIMIMWLNPYLVIYANPKEVINQNIAVVVPEGIARLPYINSDNPRNIKILWTTYTDKPGAVVVTSYNNSVNRYNSRVEFFSKKKTDLTYDYYQHEVDLNGLNSNTEYKYEIYIENIKVPREFAFKTMPSMNMGTSFIVIGDSGSDYNVVKNVRDRIGMKTDSNAYLYPHDFIIGLGDLAYHSGTYNEFEKNFFGQLSGDLGSANDQSILSSRPFFGVLGNHDYALDVNVKPKAYLDVFSFPVMNDIPKNDIEKYYSFDSGDTHFQSLDTMKFTGYSDSEKKHNLNEMLAWVDADLARTKQKWKIVFIHHAVFSGGAHGTYGDRKENRSIRQQLLPILQKHGVKLVMFGHDHLYERSRPLLVDESKDNAGRILRDKKGQIIEENGITYILVGYTGADLMNAIAPSKFGTEEWKNQLKEYDIGHDFVALDANNNPVLHDANSGLKHGFVHISTNVNSIEVQAYNYTGEIIDQVTIH